jgi:hypothetical protein
MANDPYPPETESTHTHTPPNPSTTTPPCKDPILSTSNVDPPMAPPTNNGALHGTMAILGPVDSMDIKRPTAII